MPTWNEIVKNNPAHSINYANRWQMLAEQGHDIVGEARLIDAMAQRESRILDAGCGQGRLTGFLTERGHTVVGFDVDPVLIDIAKEANPDANFYVGDLSTDKIPESDFDLIVSAGNVMGFLAPEGRHQHGLARRLACQQRLQPTLRATQPIHSHQAVAG